MKKKLVSALVSASVLLSAFPAAFPVSVSAADSTRQVEYLDRGTVAVRVDNGVFLSWRLLGTEPLDQTFDLYRDGELIEQGLDATNYTDTTGFAYQSYQVVPSGEEPDEGDTISVWDDAYYDVPLNRPEGGVTKSGESYTYSVNDTSVGDVDGDGEYEFIIKWDPSNSHDNSDHGYTGNVLIDCYEMDGTQLWRIDLGINIRAGAHYTQFMVYDFDGDGKAEMALRTAPGSKDSTGAYVSSKGKDITAGDDTADLRQGGSKNGHIIQGPDWLTMFNGETGKAMQTIDFYPQRGSVKSWGDNYGGRSERFLSAVAYLNGQTPSLIVSRGYYEKAGMAAYDWDGENFTMLWSRTDTSNNKTLYGQGNHNLSVADADNDGKDEIVFGSTVVDDNGQILNSTGHGHGDALHVSDFDNDGNQEVFQVHESADVCNDGYAAEYRRAGTGEILAGKALAGSKADNGRGVMGNIDDNVNDTAEFWSKTDSELYGTDGVSIGTQPRETNSLIYWDGDLARELLDYTRVVKYGTPDESGFERVTFDGVHSNNSSKSNAALSADIMGDWREEVMFGTNDDTALRIFTTTIPTEYKLTTLMHDTQYRCAVAWQNVGYNQPPHTSYYIGKAALSSDGKTLSPKAGFDEVAFAHTPASEEPPTPEESTTKLIDTKGFTADGEWSFSSGSVANESAPFNEVFRVTSGTSTMDLGLSPASSGISVQSFDFGTATAVIANNSGKTISPVLMQAVYTDGGTLSDVTAVSQEIENGRTGTINADPITVPTGGYVMAMLWDGIDTMVPLVPALDEQNPSYENPVQPEEPQTLKFSFDWKASASSSVQIAGEDGENIITLAKPSTGAITYQAGTAEAVSLPQSFSTAGHWFHVEMTEDPTARTIDLSIQDYTDNSDYRNIYAISFASAGYVSPAKFVIKNSCSIDNLKVEEVVYNVERALIEFNVKDEAGEPVADAMVTIGTRTLTTDADGHAAIKLKTGEYDYKITKPEYKSASGTANANEDVSIDATLLAGAERTVYTSYYFGDVEIAESVEAGKAKENTTFTVPDSAKMDITYTFPASVEDLPPGYEDYAGQTVSFEFDADQSNTVDVTVGENADTYIRLYYKEKRVPVTGLDTELLRIQFAPSGLGHQYWTSTGYEYADNNGQTIEISGSNSVTINFPQTAEKFVMEYDMIFKEMDWGGNVFGISLNNGNTVGSRIGLRASSQNTGRWEPVYNGENYITLAPGDNRYPGDYTNQRVHFIVVSNGTELLLTVANAETGELYIDNQAIPYANGIGPASKPINRVVFGRIRGNGNATYALTGFKAYTIGAEGAGEPVNTERTVVIPSTDSFALTSATHVSEVEGVDYNAATLIGVEYELRDASGSVVTPTGITLDENGTLTVAENAEAGDYYIVTLINNTPAESCKLNFLKKTQLFTSSFRNGTDGFVMQAGDAANTSLSASGGTLTFRMNDATASGGFYKIFDTPVESGKAELSFTFSTGGLKDSSDAWNWDGAEYKFYVQILDKNFNPDDAVENNGNIILELSQEYTSNAQQTYYRLRGHGAAQVAEDWERDSSISDNPVGRSSTTWNVTAELDFDQKTANFTLKSKDNEGYTLEGVSLEGIAGVGAIRFWAEKNGNVVRWRPGLSNVVFNQYVPQ